MRIECSEPAYERLKENGLIGRILDKEGVLSELFLYHLFLEDSEGEMQSRWARDLLKREGKISGLREVAKGILQLEYEIAQKEESGVRVDPWDLRDFLVEHPSLLARICLGDNVLDFERYGFSTRRNLEQAVSALCAGEGGAGEKDREAHIWRNNGYKNGVHLNMDGDMYVRQTDVTAQISNENGLFGEMVDFKSYVSVGEGAGRGISAYQDWSGFLISALRYAEAIGQKKMSEVVNWKDVLKEVGEVGTCTSEGEFGSGGIDPVPFIMDWGLAGASSDKIPIIFGYGEVWFVPVFEEGNLVFYRKGCGNYDLSKYGRVFEDERFSREIVYDTKDLPHVLRANYRLFARDKSIMRGMLEAFNAEG